MLATVPGTKILLLEDDLELNRTVTRFLAHEGFDVTPSFDADDTKAKVFERAFDLWLLDVKVPFQNGMDLLAELRGEGYDTPAIFITSLSGVDDVEKGFESGADDYIRKPFALKELRVRIDAVLRRRYGVTDKRLAIDGRFAFDPLDKRLYDDGEHVPLKPKEAELLALFLRRRDHTVTKAEIFDALWEMGEEPSEGSLRTFVKVLRSHLGRDRIETVKEVGYRFVSG
jgi:DNA-binding response OmpR family regulator